MSGKVKEVVDKRDLNVDNVERYKNAYTAGEIEECINILIHIAIYDTDNIKKRFLFSNALINPLGNKFGQKEFEKVSTIFLSTLNRLKKMGVDNEFVGFLKEMYLYTKVFYENNKSNTERLKRNRFFEYSLAEELCMICIFLQDQSRLMQEKIDETIKKNGIMTGVEPDTTFFESTYFPGVQSSASDEYESKLEMYDTLIKYLFWLKKDDLKKNNVNIVGDNLPYESPIFEELSIIAYQRMMYLKAEEKYRYSNWKISLRKNENNQDVYLFETTDNEQSMAHSVGINRRQMQFTNDAMATAFVGENGLKYIDILAQKIDVTDVDFGCIERFYYTKALGYFKSIRDVAEKDCKPYFLNCKIGEMIVKDLFDGYEFLNVLGKIYITACMRRFSQDDKSSYKYLAPIIDLQMLFETFARLYEISFEKAKGIIQEFVYDENAGREDGDIFTRPLIKVNKTSAILCQTLLEQVNMSRNVEKALHKYKVNFSDMGKQFETLLIDKLKGNAYIQVNENKIEFEAYDGKNVEFDFIGTMEDYLILIECKSVLTPYSDKELYERRKVIHEGVEQVLRRVKIVQNDWNKIREMASIPLPELPYEEDKIVKLVCTDIYDFTTLTIEDVRITDSTTLLKYFTDPFIKKVGINPRKKELSISVKKTLWEKRSPKIKEFLVFLDNPDNVLLYRRCIHPHLLPIVCFENEHYIAIEDLYLDENPFEEDIHSEMRNVRKVYPNDKCPCGSGKKYKKCCGRSNFD